MTVDSDRQQWWIAGDDSAWIGREEEAKGPKTTNHPPTNAATGVLPATPAAPSASAWPSSSSCRRHRPRPLARLPPPQAAVPRWAEHDGS
ncbi:hypothetical protein TIFTF001_053799 [Ficus carica]|uniref:Uncharacterized protein n=1 Tax=Ficus carica TaxID=3494 RepID=A0AA88EFS9_FICCA|nr:hypothetical protein TIFTF001_053799 [Ficus carica]